MIQVRPAGRVCSRARCWIRAPQSASTSWRSASARSCERVSRRSAVGVNHSRPMTVLPAPGWVSSLVTTMYATESSSALSRLASSIWRDGHRFWAWLRACPRSGPRWSTGGPRPGRAEGVAWGAGFGLRHARLRRPADDTSCICGRCRRDRVGCVPRAVGTVLPAAWGRDRRRAQYAGSFSLKSALAS